MPEKETKVAEGVVTPEEHQAVVDELAQCKAAYEELVGAFNKLLKEYNDLHIAALFKKQ